MPDISYSMPYSIGKKAAESPFPMAVLLPGFGAIAIAFPFGNGIHLPLLLTCLLVPFGSLLILGSIAWAAWYHSSEKRRVRYNRALALGCVEPAPDHFRALFAGRLYKDAGCEKPGMIRFECEEYEYDPDYDLWHHRGYVRMSDLAGLKTPTEFPVETDTGTVDAAFAALEAEVAHENRCRLDAFLVASRVESGVRIPSLSSC
jgi:hypothetical protein